MDVCAFTVSVSAVQLKDFKLIEMTFDTSVIDPSVRIGAHAADLTPTNVTPQKAKASSFYFQDLTNNSPGTVKTSVSGTKKTSKVVTLKFDGSVSNSTSPYNLWLYKHTTKRHT